MLYMYRVALNNGKEWIYTNRYYQVKKELTDFDLCDVFGGRKDAMYMGNVDGLLNTKEVIEQAKNRQESEVYKVPIDTLPGPKIVSKIDIKNINSSTRPIKFKPNQRSEPAKRKKAGKVDGTHCFYCGQSIIVKSVNGKLLPNSKTTDHIHPLSKGGSNHRSNYVPCCNQCNLLKSDFDIYEFRYYVSCLIKRVERKEAHYLTINQLRIIYKNVNEFISTNIQVKGNNGIYYRLRNEPEPIHKLSQKEEMRIILNRNKEVFPNPKKINILKEINILQKITNEPEPNFHYED